jgi:hypothetical protein
MAWRMSWRSVNDGNGSTSGRFWTFLASAGVGGRADEIGRKPAIDTLTSAFEGKAKVLAYPLERRRLARSDYVG